MAPRPAKITPPRPSGAILRSRLFAPLDELRQGGALWICGQPGSGKTTLVASWLAARRARSVWLRIDPSDADLATFFHYLASAAAGLGPGRPLPVLTPEQDVESFAHRFFRALYERMPRGAVLVLDDVHELAPDTPLHGVLRILVEELPSRVAAILVSRGVPPPALARARANGSLLTLPTRALELTADESWALALRHGFRGGRKAAAALHRAAHGWAAGLVLLLARSGANAARDLATHSPTFDFFAGEVFERSDPETRRVLLEVALLKAPTASIAERATGNPIAPKVLASLARRGLFTLRHDGDDPAFEFHALFRRFLLERGREVLPAARIDEVRRAAAATLAERGGEQAEAAIELLADAEAYEEVARLVAREAPPLLAAGRAAVVEGWLARIPAHRLESDPWLLYFSGAAKAPRDPEGARARLERAFEMFEARGDPAGVWLSWAAVVEATLFAWRDFSPIARRLDELDGLMSRFPIPAGEVEVRVMLVALAAHVHHAPGHPALRHWCDAARALALQPGDGRARLVAGAYSQLYTGWWTGDIERVRPIVEALRSVARDPGMDPAVAIFWLSVEAPFHVLAGDEVAAARTAEEARQLADASGVHVWDVLLPVQEIWRLFRADDVAGARAAVGRLAGKLRAGSLLDVSFLRLLEAMTSLRAGAFADAIQKGNEAKELGEQTRYPTVHVMADLLLARALTCGEPGRRNAADAAFASAREKIASIGSPSLEHVLALAEADRAVRGGDLDAAAAALARAVATAGAGTAHARYFFSRGELAGLLAVALRLGVEPEAVRRIIRSHGLPRVEEAGGEWPCPTRIRVLGQFEVEQDGTLLDVKARSLGKPLLLLRAIVALGGRDVPREVVADALWPEAEADAALHAVETTLYRLRRLIGQGAIVQRNRRLSIALDRCWVDALELEDRLATASAALERKAHDLDPASAQAEAIVGLYRGPLLPGEAEPWAAQGRARFRRKVARWLDLVERVHSDPAHPRALRARLAGADGELRERVSPPLMRRSAV
jgi:ATP/maltotriose-dependent transcriptional regulator MalT